MHAMWKPKKFKYIYLLATLYVFTLTIPSASAVYWAFEDQLLNHSNAFSLLPKTGFRDAAVILMLIHQFITFGFACTPLYFVWEKVIGMHDTKSLCLRALARLPVNAAEKPPFFLPSWTAMYAVNAVIVVWVLVIGFRFGGWASMTNFIRQIDTFGLFAKCYQCKGSNRRRAPLSLILIPLFLNSIYLVSYIGRLQNLPYM
ncbi:hypothetical protein V6N12_031917 [Hibiscus sabdariffa]|uniref:Amino acid transporter transmembrane domain-containing protein n=1 Tax=Hibiscus sabdariffa TaxID=183260 RepID=A0ABR2BYJ3_9ROSI